MGEKTRKSKAPAWAAALEAHVRASKTTSWSKIAGKLDMTEGGIRHWRNGTREIKLAEFVALCEAAGTTPTAMLGGGSSAPRHDAEAFARDAREEIVLYLYRGMFQLQQERLLRGLRALFDANQITRKELGQKPLRGVTDDQVRDAFGDAPFHRMKKIEKRRARRDIGDAMGDFFDEP